VKATDIEKHMFKNLLNKLQNRWAAFAALAFATVLGFCQSANAAAADPSTVTSSATTAYEAVTTLVVAMVIFWTIIAIVKRVRKGS